MPKIFVGVMDSPMRIAKGAMKIELEFIIMLTSTAVLSFKAKKTALPIPNIPVSPNRLIISGCSIKTFRLLASPLSKIYIIAAIPALENLRNATRVECIPITSHKYLPATKTVLQRMDAMAPRIIALVVLETGFMGVRSMDRKSLTVSLKLSMKGDNLCASIATLGAP
jgi:hypothetical protein